MIQGSKEIFIDRVSHPTVEGRTTVQDTFAVGTSGLRVVGNYKKSCEKKVVQKVWLYEWTIILIYQINKLFF